MKKLYFLLFTFLMAAVSYGQITVLQESFETDGNGSRYTTSVPEFTDGTGGDFFTRTDGTAATVPSYYEVSGQDGTFYFAAMDTNGDGQPTVLTLNFTGVDISTFTNMTFAIIAAEDDASDLAEDWDADASVLVEINIDGGGFTKLIQFSSGGATNTEPGLDTDFDGVADGLALTPTFQEFTASIGTGTSADIRITFTNLESGDEDIAIDNIRIIDGYVGPPTLYLIGLPPSGSTIEVGPEDLNGELEFAVANFTLSNDNGSGGSDNSGDGYIIWDITNNTDNVLHASGSIFDISTPTPFATLEPNKEYFLASTLVDNGGNVLQNPESIYILTANTLGYNVVADIAALRTHVGTNGEGLYYEITGASLVTHTDSYQNRKWIQDGNVSGLLISDVAGTITTTYNVGDNVTGLKGQTSLSSGGLLTLTPSTDSGVVESSGNSITPQVVTIPDFNTNYANYESEIVELQDVTFDAGDGVAVFATGTNYNVSDAGTNIVVMRTDYFGADYIGEVIPSTTIPSLVAVAGKFGTTAQIYARSLSDFALSNKSYDNNLFSVYPNPTSYGNVNISSKSQAAMKVGVYDILGKQVINTTVNNNRLDVSRLNTGIYIMKISQDNATTTKKLVIK